MDRVIDSFEKVVVYFLLIMMMLVVALSAVELGIILFQQLEISPRYLLDIHKLSEIFGFFLMVFIGLELLSVMKSYRASQQLHVEVVILVAMLAATRKVIVLDYRDVAPELLFGISALIMALAGGYYLVKKVMPGDPAA